MKISVAIKVSRRINYLISMLYGEKFPFFYLCEYPRSGGTWVARMVSDYLQLSFPRNSIFPLGHSCIIHNHWPYNKRLHNPVYIVRDGRDVAVSMMFYALKNSEKNGEIKKYYERKLPSLKSRNVYGHKDLFNCFIYDWIKTGVGTKLSWYQHVNQWAFKENVILVRYEDFNSDCENTLKSLLLNLTNKPIDEELLAVTVKKNSFHKQTGRLKGEENIKSNKRKGIVGDWQNYFSSESAAIFNEFSGNLLQKFGYEKDASWIKTL